MMSAKFLHEALNVLSGRMLNDSTSVTLVTVT